MEIYRVGLFGHRTVYSDQGVSSKLEKAVKDLLREKEFVEFYMGRNGDFDMLAAAAVKCAQRDVDLKNSALSLVLPYSVKDIEYYQSYYDDIIFPLDNGTHFRTAITRRNEWIVDNCDLVIAFVEHESGGAHQALRYAQKRGVKVINLAAEKL